MTKNDGKRPEDIVAEIDARLGGLLGNVGSALAEMLEKLDAGADGEVHRNTVFDTGKGPVRAQAGLRVSLAGKTLATESSGTHSPAPVKKKPEAPAAPVNVALDSFFDGSIWTVTADLPGVSEDELEIGTEDGRLILKTTGKRRYHAELELPEGIDMGAQKASIFNGVFELTVPMAGGEQ